MEVYLIITNYCCLCENAKVLATEYCNIHNIPLIIEDDTNKDNEFAIENKVDCYPTLLVPQLGIKIEGSFTIGDLEKCMVLTK